MLGSVVRIKETIEYACNIVEIKVFKTQILLEILIRRDLIGGRAALSSNCFRNIF
jgi:hypothetical protein